MSGPYSYVPPSYWYTSGMAGMAVGFNTETCPGISIPVPESLKKMLPADQCYVGSESWDYHTGLDPFNNTHPDTQAIKNRYGEPQDIEDYSKNAQLLSYECWRAMYEAHARNFPRATGVIGWMLNSSWPSLIWQLYDFYLNPTGGFYGSKKACEPLHVQYSYDDSSIWVVNTTMKKFEKLQVDATVFNMNLEKKFKRSETVNLSPCSSIEIFKIPEIKNLSTVYFLSLIIKNETQVIDNNFYWLSIKPDIFEEKGCWYTHPLKSHANMSAIRTLPRSAVESSFQIADTSENVKVILNCRNSSNTIAFFLWAKIINKTTKELIAPVFWNDNCISLLPSENNEWIATIPKWAINGKIGVKIDGWNL